MQVHVSLVDAQGTTVARTDALVEQDESRERAGVTGVLSTRNVAPGAYAFVIEAADARRREPLQHVIQVTLDE